MWYGSTRDNIRLVHLDIEITSKCTLKCRYCANLMQYHPNELQRHEKANEVILGIDALFKHINFIEEVFILGGEPFTHPELAEIVKAVNKHREKIGYLCIASNGLCRIDERTIDALLETQIPVHITIYPRFSEAQIAKCRELRARGVNADLHTRQWTLSNQRIDGTPETFYRACQHAVAPCVTLRGTQLWYCEFACNAHALGITGEYIDLSHPVDNVALYEYLDPVKPFSACVFCSGFNDICVEAGGDQCAEPIRW